MYKAIKKLGPYSCAFRQPSAIDYSHCGFIHGYGLKFKLVFKSHTLDKRDWVIDYGAFKPVKDFLTSIVDHRTIISQKDPEAEYFIEGAKRGIFRITWLESFSGEHLAKYVYDYVDKEFLPYYKKSQEPWGVGKIWCSEVSVSEHWANACSYVP